MENFFKNVVQIQKTTLENSLNIVSAMQEMTEQTIKTACDGTPWVPQQAKEMVGQLVGCMKTNRSNIKELVTKSFDQMTEAITSQTSKMTQTLKG